MRNTKNYLVGLTALLAAVCSTVTAASPAIPRPEPATHPGKPLLDASISRGVAFLLADQNPDGSWGSVTRTKGLNIYAPVPGAHHAFRTAVTSLCLSALIEYAQDTKVQRSKDTEIEKVNAAIQRGEQWLVGHLPQVRRATPDAIYNVWTHAYSIECLTKIIGYGESTPERKQKLVELIELQVTRLKNYQTIDGGWGYYDFRAHTQKPTGSPTSFTTATVLLALEQASRFVGVPVSMSQRAVASINRQRKPDYSYLYSDSGPTKNRPMRSINRPGGSLGRSQVCNLALRRWDKDSVSTEVINDWLDRLFARNLWLDMGRKRPIPHESHFLVAGYFYYYGHYYAAHCIDELPTEMRPPHRAQLAKLLLGLQEADGSWWDYPLYNYHQQYGTAMVVMSLLRCPADQTSL